MFWVGVITAGMTAFYVFRAIFMCFFGTYRGKAHPHESPFVMIAPLVVLAFLSLAGGWLFKIPEFLTPVLPLAEEGKDMTPMIISVTAGFIGIFLAAYMYVWRPGLSDVVSKLFGPLYNLVYNKFFVDEVYGAVIVTPVVSGSRTVLWKWVDAGLIDGTVNGVGTAARGVGGVLKLLQSGNIRSYAVWVLLGSVCVLSLVAMGLMGGVR